MIHLGKVMPPPHPPFTKLFWEKDKEKKDTNLFKTDKPMTSIYYDTFQCKLSRQDCTFGLL